VGIIKLILAGLFGAILSASASQAQNDPRMVLQAVIQQLQTGTPNPMWYGQELWGLISQQTGNSGIYPQLQQLGTVKSVTIDGSIQLPSGPVYAMTAQHQNGNSFWNIGISTYSNRIEYANFSIESSMPLPDPGRSPSPAPTPGTDSDACRQFPNLC
jgi:hypothetical protein